MCRGSARLTPVGSSPGGHPGVPRSRGPQLPAPTLGPLSTCGRSKEQCSAPAAPALPLLRGGCRGRCGSGAGDAAEVNPSQATWWMQNCPMHHGRCKPVTRTMADATLSQVMRWMQTPCMHHSRCKPIASNAMAANPSHAQWWMPTCHKRCDGCSLIACTTASANPSPVT